MKKLKFVTAAALMAIFVLVFCGAAFAKEYMVVRKVAPIAAKAGIKYKGNAETFTPIDGIDGSIVYGNIVEAFPIKGKDAANWMELKVDDESVGFIEKNALTEMPNYEEISEERFWVKEDNTQLFLLPGADPISKKYGGISLYRGMTVTGIGELKKGSETWILLVFESFVSQEGESSGAGVSHKLKGEDYWEGVSRFAWAKLSDLVRLRGYSPDNSKVDAKFLPNTVIREQAFRNHDISIKDKIREQFIKNGFRIDPTPIILGSLNIDDLIESYGNTVPENKELDELFMQRFPNHKSLLPKFITVDFALHSFHLIFDRLLQKAEVNYLSPRLSEFLGGMAGEGKFSEKDEVSEFVRQYLLLAQKLLTGTGELSRDAEGEYQKIMSAGTVGESFFTGKREDYTFYKPRGHYTLSDGLQKYFRAMTFLGGTTFFLKDEANPKRALFNTAVIAKMCSLMDDEKTLALWKKLFDPITNLIGASNDNSWYDFAPVVKKFGEISLSDEAKLNELRLALIAAARPPLVIGRPAPNLNATQEERTDDALGFRLLGRRFTFDAMLFSTLTSPNVGTPQSPRNLPDALDVMAVLGSKAALEETKAFHTFEKYAKNQAELINKWKSFSGDPLSKNFYTKWLSLYDTYFAQTDSKQYFHGTSAWGYKKLLTAAASYAELKHDTILYAEQSGAEMGDAGDYFLAAPFKYPMPLGYVEPEPALFNKLSDCALAVLEFLEGTGIEDEEYNEKLNAFSELALTLGSIAEKQISDEPISFEDYDYIHSGFLNNIDGMILPGELRGGMSANNPEVLEQLRMALVADIATDFGAGKALYVATGTPRQVQVFVNDKNGGARVTFGYMFSFYNFAKGLSEGRMNDTEWKKLVYDKKKQNEVEKLLPSWYEKVN